ncbi:hypothetical protein BCR32DRAFT_292822 [Anaeromyces robustus]|uniref:LysM domain-containing protein n=1 Tax=Anaeromyces robustus TaxID=1754192 RepID=A0A1Y1X8W5_9FUNG|nr:hypothetical protein BCR32DRAFT_292822 [Anaeromyces robustus]|eukprot:ORX82193.1 hypothetical protein BCR32DRAFT_292822 [Anaeromyces robustus]
MITHIVKKTDTLEGISLKYNVPIEKIKKANKIWSKNVLLCMDKILIPEENDLISSNNSSAQNIIITSGNEVFNTSNNNNNNINNLSTIITTNNNTNINNNMYNNNNTTTTTNNNNNTTTTTTNNIYNNNIYHNSIYHNDSCDIANNNSQIYHDSEYSGSENDHILSSIRSSNDYSKFSNRSSTIKYDCSSEKCSIRSSSTTAKISLKRDNSSSSDLSLDELFETIDKSVMDTVNKSNISLPLLIKSQLEVYQDIPTSDPIKDNKISNFNSMQKSFSFGCINNNNNNDNNSNNNSNILNQNGNINRYMKDNTPILHSHSMLIQSSSSNPNINNNGKYNLYINSNNGSQSSLLCSYDGYNANDYDYDVLTSSSEPKKTFLQNEHEKVNKILDKLSISTNIDGIHNLVNRLSSRDISSAMSEPVNTSLSNKYKHNSEYLEIV